MKTSKRILSLLLSLVMVFTMLPLQAMATEPETETSVDTGDLTVEGTNGFGALLSQEIQESQEESAEAEEAYEAGYSVVDLTFEGATATVEYSSLEEAILVVAVYSEDGLKMLASGSVQVNPDEDLATVTIEGDMPEYFLASAYLMDTYDLSPLCMAYDTPMYTREMQELLASTVDDYDPEKVLNLDEDETTNFAVYADSTIVIEGGNGVNSVTLVDDENSTYVIADADETVTGLTVGDVFVYPYTEGEILIVKVASIKVDGTVVTITGDELEMEEVFSYVKIEGDGNTTDLIVDEDSGDEGVTYTGMHPDEGVNPSAWEDDAELEFSMGFNVEKRIDEYSSFSGSLGIKFNLEFEYYISLKRQFIRFEYGSEVAIGIKYEFKNNAPIPKATSKLELKSFGYSPVAGLYIGFEPEVIVEFTATVEVSCTLSTSGGFTFETGKDILNLSKKPTVDIDIVFEGIVFFGIDFGPHISIVKDNVAKIKLSSQVGLELVGKPTGSMFEDITIAGDYPVEKHDCESCVRVELAVKSDFSLRIELLKCNWLTFESELAAKRYKIGVCYSSDTYLDFGWGECPHKLYRLTVMVSDEEGKAVSDATVVASGERVETNGNGIVNLYVMAGTYTVTASLGELTVCEEVEVEQAKKVSLCLSNEEESGDPFDDWWDGIDFGGILGDEDSEEIIDEVPVDSGICGENLKWVLSADGVLTISGSGPMANYSSVRDLPWFSYKDSITSVEITAGVTSIGSYAFYYHKGLTSVSIPESVLSFGTSCFESCPNLSSITIPHHVTTIGDYAFADCASLICVMIPESVISIGSFAFYDCPSLTGIFVDGNNLSYASDEQGVLFNKEMTQLIQALGN